jgi:hypothetical protein
MRMDSWTAFGFAQQTIRILAVAVATEPVGDHPVVIDPRPQFRTPNCILDPKFKCRFSERDEGTCGKGVARAMSEDSMPGQSPAGGGFSRWSQHF